jgi:O-acetyl-ADP-ribose deacetylase (regulator of RNase III)
VQAERSPQEVSGNILQDESEALVAPTNTEGIQGKGLAKAFAVQFPEWDLWYKRYCASGEMRMGRCAFQPTRIGQRTVWIVALPTKRSPWDTRADIVDIASALDNLVVQLRTRKVLSIAIPALGCGCGELRWFDVRPHLIEAAQRMQGVHVRLYRPQ